jgi:hypothetical protein
MMASGMNRVLRFTVIYPLKKEKSSPKKSREISLEKNQSQIFY